MTNDDETKTTGSTVITVEGDAYLASFKSKTREGLAKMIRDYTKDTSATVGDVEELRTEYQSLRGLVVQNENTDKQLLTETHELATHINELFSEKMSKTLNFHSKLYVPIEVDIPDPEPTTNGIPDQYGNIRVWKKGQVIDLAPLADVAYIWVLRVKDDFHLIPIRAWTPTSDPVRLDHMSIDVGNGENALMLSARGENAKLQLTFNAPPQDIGMFQLLKLF